MFKLLNNNIYLDLDYLFWAFNILQIHKNTINLCTKTGQSIKNADEQGNLKKDTYCRNVFEKW